MNKKKANIPGARDVTLGTSVGRVNGIKKETIKKPYLWLETRHLEPLLLLLPLLAVVGLHWLSWAFIGLLVWCRGLSWACVGLRRPSGSGLGESGECE